MKILIINANPDKDSFCAGLADSYLKGALSKGHEPELVHLADLEFDPVLHYGYKKRQELEPDLKNVQDKIKNSDHLVLVFPTWWTTYPALLKGFIDRVIISGFGFKFHKGSPFPEKLLKGISARLIITMDGPSFWYKLFLGKPGLRAVKRGTLAFCGIKPVKHTIFGSIKFTDEEKRKKMLAKVFKIGEKVI